MAGTEEVKCHKPQVLITCHGGDRMSCPRAPECGYVGGGRQRWAGGLLALASINENGQASTVEWGPPSYLLRFPIQATGAAAHTHERERNSCERAQLRAARCSPAEVFHGRFSFTRRRFFPRFFFFFSSPLPPQTDEKVKAH